MLLERPYCLCLTLPGNQNAELERWRVATAMSAGVIDMDLMVPHLALGWGVTPPHRHTLLELKKTPWHVQQFDTLDLAKNYWGQPVLILSSIFGLLEEKLSALKFQAHELEVKRGQSMALEPSSGLILSSPFNSWPKEWSKPSNTVPVIRLSAPLLSVFFIEQTSQGYHWHLIDEMRVNKG